ncbi:MAG: beta-ketoacyl-ACP synthase III [Phycisphaerales bacterium]|nr:beta-ketoacyl-ACP synthase III [Phycisphaerales bacterium]
MTSSQLPCGVRIRGTGSCVPERVLTNHDLSKMVDTSDEWIVQRTGIRERRICDPAREGTFTMSRDALARALDAAKMKGSDLDLIIVGTVTGEMACPSVATRVGAALGAVPAAAFDIAAACCGFVYAINLADTLIRAGRFRAVGVVGAEALSTITDWADRGTSILFGDAAGAAVLVRDPDPRIGCLYQTMGADGSAWESLYIPRHERDIPEKDRANPITLGNLRMNGKEVFRFAVNKFREVMEDALTQAGLDSQSVGQIICHQSNVRIIEAARERLALPPEKLYINIDKYGNTSAGSVGLCLDELWRAGKIEPERPFVMVAFGGGLTWASGVWRV